MFGIASFSELAFAALPEAAEEAASILLFVASDMRGLVDIFDMRG